MTAPIALTGATGFIGGAVLRALRATGQSVRVLVRGIRPPTAAWRREGLEVIVGDLDTPDALARLVRGADAVIHCAATMGKTDPRRSYDVNVVGTERLARLARQGGVPRFVHLSTISVYAATRRPHDVITEDDPPEHIDRLNHYGHSKWLAEQRLAEAAGREMAFTIIRPTNVYGPGSGPWFAQWAEYARRMPVAIGDLDIDLVHVDDLVDAVLRASRQTWPDRSILHVGHGPARLNEFVRAIGAITGRHMDLLPPRVDRWVRTAIEQAVRLATGRHMSMSLTRSVRYPHTNATAVLGYRPRVALPEGLARLAEWWQTRTTPNGALAQNGG